MVKVPNNRPENVYIQSVFMGKYPENIAPYHLFQAHPPCWDTDSFTAFVRIAERVMADGWRSEAPAHLIKMNGLEQVLLHFVHLVI